jgi:microcystin-dependent protein
MSSTYSPNLAIELMGAGDQAGNWGSTTNTNLGTLIEQAISGYTTYSCTGGTDTLAMTSGASATARNMYLELGGTGGGTLVVPANKKLYFIYNTNASAVTVKVSGQTGVSVPAGAKICLVCNGTDVVVAENYMVSPTFSNATLTGTPVAPTASVGTNTTQIATTAFVNSAIVAAYPVGSIYMSTVSTNPATLFGFGTWVAYGQGRMPISADGTYTAGSTGGSATTTLSTTNLPSHTHSFSATSGNPNTSLNHRHYVGSRDSTADNGGNYAQEFVSDAGSGYGPNTYTNYQDLQHTHDISGTTGSAGSGTAVTTISPYIAVYMWTRTA